MNRLVISPLPHISNVKSSSYSSIQARPGEISGWIWASFAEAIRPTASRAFTTITSRPPWSCECHGRAPRRGSHCYEQQTLGEGPPSRSGRCCVTIFPSVNTLPG